LKAPSWVFVRLQASAGLVVECRRSGALHEPGGVASWTMSSLRSRRMRSAANTSVATACPACSGEQPRRVPQPRVEGASSNYRNVAPSASIAVSPRGSVSERIPHFDARRRRSPAARSLPRFLRSISLSTPGAEGSRYRGRSAKRGKPESGTAFGHRIRIGFRALTARPEAEVP